ncbi:class II aldolase/adducin family protein, partial [Pseudomonas quasicaspiana]|nr:class II aldolase/adducin family protein [Pseudomonas quasicaspiana]
MHHAAHTRIAVVDLALQREVYDRNPGVGGVVHTHSTHLVALTLAGVWQEDNILP